MFLFIKLLCVSSYLGVVAVSKDFIHLKKTVRSHPWRHFYVGSTRGSYPPNVHLPCYIRFWFTHSLSLIVAHGGPSYSAIYLKFVKHSHSDVNSVIAIVSSYVMESLNAVWWLDRIPIKLQLTSEPRLSFQLNDPLLTQKSRFVSTLQMFEQLGSNGNTTFSINISESCETCYNVRMLKVRVTEHTSIFSYLADLLYKVTGPLALFLDIPSKYLEQIVLFFLIVKSFSLFRSLFLSDIHWTFWPRWAAWQCSRQGSS